VTTQTTTGCPKCGNSETDSGYCVDCAPRVTVGGEFRRVPDEAWADPEGDGSRLHLSIRMWGLGLLHLTAFRVARVCRCQTADHGRRNSSTEADEMGCGTACQESDAPESWVRESYDEYCNAAGQNEPWHELEIRGRQYVIFGSPGS
jgi:hypothetical protein